MRVGDRHTRHWPVLAGGGDVIPQLRFPARPDSAEPSRIPRHGRTTAGFDPGTSWAGSFPSRTQIGMVLDGSPSKSATWSEVMVFGLSWSDPGWPTPPNQSTSLPHGNGRDSAIKQTGIGKPLTVRGLSTVTGRRTGGVAAGWSDSVHGAHTTRSHTPRSELTKHDRSSLELVQIPSCAGIWVASWMCAALLYRSRPAGTSLMNLRACRSTRAQPPTLPPQSAYSRLVPRTPS